jgi:flagellin
MMSLNTNINAMVAANAYSAATKAYSQASTRISTQLAINSAKDNPAGLGIANRWKAQIASYAKANDNVNAGISAVQIADSALTEIATVLTSMKTLATSSASGTASAATRASNQTVFETYMAQIDSIAESAEYNGASLLNGDTPSIKVQTGINSGETTTLNFSSVLSSALGTGSPLALTSLGGSTTALASGDLLINGYTIAASLSSYDSYSYASKAGSAIAKAAAINLMTDYTNVEADVGETTVAGSAMTALGTGSAGTITINGTEISLALSDTNDYATNRALVVTAINSNSGQTGVIATDTNSATLGVTLTATDGRNITVAFDGTDLTAANTGVGAASTYAGTYTLRSLDQTDITISSNVSGTIANAGLDIGTYDSNVAQVSTKKRAASTSAPTALTSGDLTINGYAIGATFTSDDTASDTTATSSTKAASAIAMAAAINRQTSLTGVTAAANPNVVVGTGFSAGTVDTIYLNGQTITAGLTAASSIDNVVTLLNNYTGQTGVTASNNGSGVTLTASDGRNISIATDTGVGAAIGISGVASTTAAAATTYIATVKLYSEATFAVSAGTEGYSDFTTLGFVAGTYGGSSDDTRVSELDISTQTGGSNAMSVLEDAIDMVSSYQALVGAQENLLGYQSDYITASNVAATTAYGNIMDYDLATESTALAAAQIKQNGAMAMLAQANVSQEMVAYLLKQYIS